MRRRRRPPAARSTACLAALAMLLRLLLPVLHGGHDCHGHPRAAAMAPACSCGLVHAAAPTGDHEPRAVAHAPTADGDHGVCLACQQQHHSPAGPLVSCRTAPPRATDGTVPMRPGSAPRSGPRHHRPPSRAPPDAST